MKKKGIILVVLLVTLGLAFGLDVYYQSIPPTERESLETRVQKARKERPMSAAQENYLRIQLALVNYQIKNRALPESLSQLVPTYFDSIPKNTETGQPFEYIREGKTYKLLGLTVSPSEVKQVAAVGLPSKCKLEDKECLSKAYYNPNEIEEDTFRYDPTGKKDPFQPFDFSARPKNPNASTPLEQYDLGQLRLTAVLADPTKGATGIIEDQAGKGFNVKIGTRIGLQSGVIVSIERDRLKVLETETDMTGKETQRIVEMKIQAEPGGRLSDPKKQRGKN